MICILKMRESEIVGWIIAPDLHEARRKIECFSPDAATHLYQMESEPKTGKHQLPDNCVMLASE